MVILNFGYFDVSLVPNVYCRVALLPGGKVAAELFSIEMGLQTRSFVLLGITFTSSLH